MARAGLNMYAMCPTVIREGCCYYWLLWNSKLTLFFSWLYCMGMLAHQSALSANSILWLVLWPHRLWFVSACLHTWVTDAIVEQGVQTHAELCLNGSSKSRCVLNHRGFCLVVFWGLRRGHGIIYILHSQAYSQAGKDFWYTTLFIFPDHSSG